jgi:hypothetical protein
VSGMLKTNGVVLSARKPATVHLDQRHHLRLTMAAVKMLEPFGNTAIIGVDLATSTIIIKPDNSREARRFHKNRKGSQWQMTIIGLAEKFGLTRPARFIPTWCEKDMAMKCKLINTP